MSTIASLFAPPRFPSNPELTRVARLLHLMFLVGIVICLGCIPVLAPIVPSVPKMVLINGAVTLFCLVLIIVNKLGRVRTAGVGALLILLVAVVVDSLSPNQTLSPAVVALFLITTYAGFAFGVRGLIIASGLNSLVLVSLLLLHLSWQPTAAERGNLYYQYLIQIFFMWTACLVLSITVRYLQQAQQRLRESEIDLAARNRRLEQEILERGQIAEQLAQRSHELSKLLEVTQTIGLRLDLRALHAVLFEKLCEVVPFAGAAVSEFVEGYNLRILSCAGDIDPQLIGSQLDFSPQHDLHLLDLIRTRQPVIISDIYADTPHANAFCARMRRNGRLIPTHVVCVMFVPLIVRDKLIGVMRLSADQRDEYDERDASLSLAFGNQAAILIESARAHQEDIMAAALKERTRIARELHDSVSQALFGIVLGVRTSLQHCQAKQDPTLALNYALTLSEAALSEIRALIFELRPEYLEKEGLIAAFRKQAEALSMRHHLDIKMRLTDDEPVLPLTAKEALYRIGLEALQNTLKHAQAKHVELTMSAEPRAFILEVKDDGKGFDPAQISEGHYGLLNMRERAAQFGATMQIESRIGRGTELRVRMPL